MDPESAELTEFWNEFSTRREEQNSQTKERDSRYGYTILSSTDHSSLEEIVVEHMKDGWRVAGGVTTYSNEAYIYYIQAMTKG